MRSDDARSFELVTPEELKQLRRRNFKHHDLYWAIREIRNMPAGQGVKVKCLGTASERYRKQKAVYAIAAREHVPVRTMLRDGWLFIEKTKPR
jgi:hypothetical protein